MIRNLVRPVFLLALSLLCVAPEAAGKGTPAQPSAVEIQNLALQRERLELDRQKMMADMAAQKERLRVDEAKIESDAAAARRTARLTLFTSTIPLIAAICTLFYSIWSFRKQMAQQSAALVDSGKLQFAIKAAEIAFAGKTPEALRNRSHALKSIFKDRLPPDFADTFDPGRYGGGKEPAEAKQFFLELLLKYPDKCSQIADYWDALFGEEWVERVRPLIMATGASSAAAGSSAAGAPTSGAGSVPPGGTPSTGGGTSP